MKILMIIIQWAFFLAVAPLVSGLITKMKNNIRMRRGPGIFQPYRNLAKYFSKGETVSSAASWIFRVAPFAAIASVLTAALLVPVFYGEAALAGAGGFLTLIFVLALGRFFLALAALDTGSAFGGMGSSREMFIASLVEPVVCLVLFALSLQYGSTNLSAITGAHCFTAASLIGALALFLVVLAETARVPVDNEETHLELTMIHEAMVLEYSGRPLALIEWASCVKQLIWFFLIAQIVFPMAPSASSGLWGVVSGCAWFAGRIALIAIAVALVEVSLAKMRLFRAVDYLGFAFVLAVLAAASGALGI